ncbi:hypothetical protein K402DRAFT_332101 [Aulographum hederae CBS 113979]|uniref:Tctex-1 n=1 Tax=Aulographum hederae CBS 113979 TaxID=1176131 RepID=A0A6G1H0V5_9PEZI|nr:hypothetical protein K402DRAFT_332101 [Aulographum hederae CBS 113979]
MSNSPIPTEKLKEITDEACNSIFSSTDQYVHASAEEWNSTIIKTILGSLLKLTSSPSTSDSKAQQSHKYMVTSTILQHTAPVSTSSPDPPSNPEKPADSGAAGRRGMHAAAGAFWDAEKDGMWSYKYAAADAKGMDAVICIMWVCVM